MPDEDDPILTGTKWEKWLNRFQRQISYFKIEDPADQKNALLIYGGEKLEDVEDTETDPPDPTPPIPAFNPYTRLVAKLNSYFLPKKSRIYCRYVFHKMVQDDDETILAFSTRLKEQAKYCEFEDKDDMVLVGLVCGIKDDSLRRKAFTKPEWKLADFLQFAVTLEDSKIQVQQMYEPDKLKQEVLKVLKQEN